MSLGSPSVTSENACAKTPRLLSAVTLLVSLATGALAACSSSPSETPDGGTGTVDARGRWTLPRGDATVSLESGAEAAPSPDAEAGLDASACPPGMDMPPQLSCTGLYSDWPTKTIAADAIPYTPAFILWSDGAVKQRWISLPASSRIDTTNLDDWTFPIGTKIWKSFTVGGQLIETRLEWKTADQQWTFAVYRWSADGTTAPLLTTGEQNVNGTTYEIPTTDECRECHGGRLDSVLGFDLIGTGTAGAQGLTLATLAANNQLTAVPPAIAIPDDTTGKAPPALGWLHANCGATCHNTNPNAKASRLRPLYEASCQPDSSSGWRCRKGDGTRHVPNVRRRPLESHAAGPRLEARIAPGDSGASLLPLMDLARNSDAGFKAMPPLVSNQPDVADVALVQAWIDAL